MRAARLIKDDRSHVAEVMDLTRGAGADVVLDYVAHTSQPKPGQHLCGPLAFGVRG